jgi:hypothetical protein
MKKRVDLRIAFTHGQMPLLICCWDCSETDAEETQSKMRNGKRVDMQTRGMGSYLEMRRGKGQGI